MIKLVKWPTKIKFSRGPSEATQYSTGGENGEEVEVPQLDESLSGNDFFQALVNVVGSEEVAKQLINKNVFAYPAIKEGQQTYKGTHKKSSVMDNKEATNKSILAIREYVPTLTKERGAVVTEAFQKAAKMDALQAAREKVARNEMTQDEFFAMLESAFTVAE